MDLSVLPEKHQRHFFRDGRRPRVPPRWQRLTEQPQARRKWEGTITRRRWGGSLVDLRSWPLDGCHASGALEEPRAAGTKEYMNSSSGVPGPILSTRTQDSFLFE